MRKETCQKLPPNKANLRVEDLPLSLLRQASILLRREIAGSSPYVQLEHSLSGFDIWQRDVDTLFESAVMMRMRNSSAYN